MEVAVHSIAWVVLEHGMDTAAAVDPWLAFAGYMKHREIKEEHDLAAPHLLKVISL